MLHRIWELLLSENRSKHIAKRSGSHPDKENCLNQELDLETGGRRDERKPKLELAKMKLEKEQAFEEKRLALEQRKLTQELNLRELDIGALQ
ncbi:hypothetical protein NDU88_004169 [Pleurodeles waltl]|uniref:Uncharacterized protein n=1 Tax=Pleurodeles waltl TaxID=8319 RepID=A0AAV7MFU4_PLEWA|nr:hypothetical protein NDU88_004169 [Pleurodeles waltl]